MKSWKRRPLIGRFLIAISSTVVVRTVALVSTSGDSFVTVTVSVTAPTCIVVFTVSVAPTVRMRLRFVVVKPGSSTLRS